MMLQKNCAFVSTESLGMHVITDHDGFKKIVSIDSMGQAEKEGLQRGDSIMSVGPGIPVGPDVTHDEFISIVQKIKTSSTTLNMVVVRPRTGPPSSSPTTTSATRVVKRILLERDSKLGLQIEGPGSMMVVEVTKGGQADRQGVKVGDVIAGVQDLLLSSCLENPLDFGELVALIQEIQKNPTTDFVVINMNGVGSVSPTCAKIDDRYIRNARNTGEQLSDEDEKFQKVMVRGIKLHKLHNNRRGKDSRIFYITKDLDTFVCGQKKFQPTDKFFSVRDVQQVRLLTEHQWLQRNDNGETQATRFLITYRAGSAEIKVLKLEADSQKCAELIVRCLTSLIQRRLAQPQR